MAHKNPNYPTAFGVHVCDALYQSSRVEVDENTTDERLDKIMRERFERGQYITWLSHRGPLGGFGAMDFINALPGN